MVGYDPENSSFVPHGIESRSIESEWTVDFGQDIFTLTPPLLSGDLAVTTSPDSLTAISRETGEVKASTELPGNVAGCPAIGQKRAFVPRDAVGWGFQSADIEAPMLSVHHTENWKSVKTTSLDGQIAYAVCLDNDVYVQTNTKLYALDTRGNIKWSSPFDEDLSRYRTESRGQVRPITDSNSVYALCSGGVCRIDKQTGEQKWRTGVPETKSAPALSNDGVVVVTAHSGTRGIDADSGEILWEVDEQSHYSPAVKGSTAILPLSSGVRAVSTKTGEPKWTSDVKTLATDPIIVDNQIIAGQTGGCIRVLDLKTGKVIRSWMIEGQLKSIVPSSSGVFVTRANDVFEVVRFR